MPIELPVSLNSVMVGMALFMLFCVVQTYRLSWTIVGCFAGSAWVVYWFLTSRWMPPLPM